MQIYEYISVLFGCCSMGLLKKDSIKLMFFLQKCQITPNLTYSSVSSLSKVYCFQWHTLSFDDTWSRRDLDLWPLISESNLCRQVHRSCKFGDVASSSWQTFSIKYTTMYARTDGCTAPKQTASSTVPVAQRHKNTHRHANIHIYTDIIFSSGEISCEWLLSFGWSNMHLIFKLNTSLLQLVHLHWLAVVK